MDGTRLNSRCSEISYTNMSSLIPTSPCARLKKKTVKGGTNRNMKSIRGFRQRITKTKVYNRITWEVRVRVFSCPSSNLKRELDADTKKTVITLVISTKYYGF